MGKLNQAITPPCVASSGVQHHTPVDPYSHHLQYASYQHSQNPNPNPYVPIDPIKAQDQGLSPLGLTLALLLAHWPIATEVPTIPVWPMLITWRRSMPLDVIRIQTPSMLCRIGQQRSFAITGRIQMLLWVPLCFVVWFVSYLNQYVLIFDGKNGVFKRVEIGTTVIEMWFEFPSIKFN